MVSLLWESLDEDFKRSVKRFYTRFEYEELCIFKRAQLYNSYSISKPERINNGMVKDDISSDGGGDTSNPPNADVTADHGALDGDSTIDSAATIGNDYCERKIIIAIPGDVCLSEYDDRTESKESDAIHDGATDQITDQQKILEKFSSISSFLPGVIDGYSSTSSSAPKSIDEGNSASSGSSPRGVINQKRCSDFSSPSRIDDSWLPTSVSSPSRDFVVEDSWLPTPGCTSPREALHEIHLPASSSPSRQKPRSMRIDMANTVWINDGETIRSSARQPPSTTNGRRRSGRRKSGFGHHDHANKAIEKSRCDDDDDDIYDDDIYEQINRHGFRSEERRKGGLENKASPSSYWWRNRAASHSSSDGDEEEDRINGSRRHREHAKNEFMHFDNVEDYWMRKSLFTPGYPQLSQSEKASWWRF